MENMRINLSKRTIRGAVAGLAAAALIGGATWHALAADPPASAPQSAAAAAAPGISHAVTAGHDSYADIVKVVAPAVVTIRTEGKAKISPTDFQGDDDLFRRFFGQQSDPEQFGRRGQRTPAQPRTFRQSALGSGVIVSNDGYVLTNNHVVDDADNIKVELTDGRSFTAKVIGKDKPSDLALLKIEASGLHPLALGNSDRTEVGDVVLAVGNPLGLGQTVTMGIISAKGRQTDFGDGTYEDFLQTDAPINHGNSGGALVNTSGELIGINSQIASVSDGNIGIGFAIPANMARRVMEDLRHDGRVSRGRLGVSIQPVTAEMAESLGLKSSGGAIVSSVEPDSAAERAGIKRNDIIKSFNGEPVHDINALRNHVADAKPGSAANVVIERDGREQTMSVKLDEAAASKTARDDSSAPSADKGALGISASPLTPELAARAGVPKSVQGVFVQDVNPDGRAAEAGIQPGDVIEEANRQPVKSVEELRSAVRSSANKPVLLLVNREGRDIFVTVKPS
jgi:Do/DeqQ family serine protease